MSFDPTLTIGALEVGVLLSYVLFGVTTTQTYIYYGRFPEDSRALKSLVAFVWCCELAHVVCIGHTIHVMTVDDLGHPERLVRMPQPFMVAVMFSALIAAFVQGFFAFRIYCLSRLLYIPCLSWTLSLVRLICSLVVFASGLYMNTLQEFEAQSRRLLATIWSVSALNDLLIAGTLVHWLHRLRGNPETRTAAMVDKLIAWTIETGVVTSAVGIATLVLFLVMPQNYVFLATFVIAARLFANSLLASLNSRASLRAENLVTRELGTLCDIPRFNRATSSIDIQLSKVRVMEGAEP
ncbi:hypothetical protein DFH09DRAFT_2960 [Mycena vulgaris]|nr:hypothetical protein DFH09DRAFT_2960 [Mycena vulgaris]